MGDLGLAYATNGDLDATAAMGGQPAEPLAVLLQEITITEDAVQFESKSVINLILTVRNFRYNLTPALVLDADDDPSGMPKLPAEITDDLPIHNLIVVSDRAGGEYTVEDSTSPMGTQPPPDGRGEYRQDRDVNLFDPNVQMPQQANWWLRRGTVNLPRYPQVTVDLAALGPEKIVEVEAVTVGSVIEIDGYREYTIRLHVLGYTEVIGSTSRIITFTCEPDQQFQTGVYDGDSEYTPRYDLRSCTLSAAAAAAATTLSLAIVDDETWSQTSAYDLLISGELIGVPVGAMGARGGTAGAYTQTITGALRGRNGIMKLLPAGAEVHIETPGRWAL